MMKKPTVRITENFWTDKYTIVKVLNNDFCVIRLNEPFPPMDSFPEVHMEGIREFVTKVDPSEYRDQIIDEILNN